MLFFQVDKSAYSDKLLNEHKFNLISWTTSPSLFQFMKHLSICDDILGFVLNKKKHKILLISI